jgi:hypothetical protein
MSLLTALYVGAMCLEDTIFSSCPETHSNNSTYTLLILFILQMIYEYVNTPASYSGGPGFKSQPGDWLTWTEVYHGFTQYPQENSRTVP